VFRDNGGMSLGITEEIIARQPREAQAIIRFAETLLTVIETCRQQGRNVFAFLTNAGEAHLAHQPAPSLLAGV